MNVKEIAIGFGLAFLLVACGGGGGSAGTVANAAPTLPATGTTGSLITDLGTVKVELLSGSGQETQSISAIEIAVIKVTVKDVKGVAVPGTIVTFSETGVGLLKFAPDSKTALTTSEGVATLEVRAADPTKVGATTISVDATVALSKIVGTKILEVTNAPVSAGIVIDPQTLATAINFVSTDPADKAIVLKGAGGNGRTETGILSFRVVDKNGTPVKGVTVDFVVNPSNDVVLNISQGKTDSDGLVVTSVSSKLVATSVVVKATVNGKTITSQSDQLKVTTGLGVARGFEILPLVYNLDGALSGDSTQVTARLVDANSNPVADGVPVVLVASGGKIGSSAAGGCNTVNGACTVTFEVQNPRPANGLVDISGSAKVGESTTLFSQIKVHMSLAAISIFEPVLNVPAFPLSAPSEISITNCNKVSKTYMISNAIGYSAPSGTTIAAESDTATGLGASIKGGNTVLDVKGFGPSFFDFVIDPTGANNPPCSNTGIDFATAVTRIVINAPKSKRESRTDIVVKYPAGELKLIQLGTADEPVDVKVAGCGFETTQVEAVGSAGLTLPLGSTFAVRPSEASALVSVSTTEPNVADPAVPTNITKELFAASNTANRQSIWLRIKAPDAGVNPCGTGGKPTAATFTADVTITSTNGQRNTKKVTVTYPKSGV